MEMTGTFDQLNRFGPEAWSPADLDFVSGKLKEATAHCEAIDGIVTTLPSEDAATATIRDKLVGAKSALKGIASDLRRIEATVAGAPAVEKTGGSPELKAAAEQLSGMAAMLGDTQVFHNDPEKAERICKQIKPMQKFSAAVRKKHAAALTDGVGELSDKLAFYEQRLSSFAEAMHNFTEAAPAMIEHSFQMASDLASESVEHKRAGAFGESGAVNSQMRDAASRLAILRAINAKAATYKALQKKHNSLKKKFSGMMKKLRDDMIRSKRKPADNYSNEDREELIAGAKAQWSALYPKDEIVGMVIPAADWKRTTEWRWHQRNWYLYDHSLLKVTVGVQEDKDHIGLYYVNLVKNHLEDDRLSFDVQEKKRAGIEALMLASNW